MTTSVGARGPERNAREASVGLPPGHEDQGLFPPEEAGGIFPAPSTKKSAPYDSKRAGLAPGPWKHLALTAILFHRTKVLQIFISSFLALFQQQVSDVSKRKKLYVLGPFEEGRYILHRLIPMNFFQPRQNIPPPVCRVQF